MNPFSKMPHIHSPPLLIEIALTRGSKTPLPPKSKGWIKRLNLRRIQRSYGYVESRLSEIVKWYKRMKNIDPFYLELLDILIGLEDFENAMEKISRALAVIRMLKSRYSKRILKVDDEESGKIWKEAFGRLASVIKRNKRAINIFREAKNKLSKLPSIDRSFPLIVIAGPPNVGKSSLVKTISTAKTEVASYPFTTKNVILGHILFDEKRIQVMDTPGLLDQPLERRSAIERQAIAALKLASDIVIFMIDPSETCGYTLDYQEKVLIDVLKIMYGKSVIGLINKIDICKNEELKIAEEIFLKNGIDEIYKISIKTGAGIDVLFAELINRFK